MGLMDLAAEFVKILNSNIAAIDIEDKETLEKIEKLKNRIQDVMGLLENSESNANALLSKLDSQERKNDDVIYIKKEGELRAMVSRDVVKPVIREVEMLEDECGCIFDEMSSFESSGKQFQS